MIARAPGKVVLSGAYAVLEGAPALVAAVDRYVVADSGREAIRVVPEVAEALRLRGAGRAPWFDARELRDERREQKLGLGSSAAILVASLAALELAGNPQLGDEPLADLVYPLARAAHRAAQGGGSGVDVAASAFGGILVYRIAPSAERVELPRPLFFQIWAARRPASTAEMIGRVREAKEARPQAYDAIIRRLWAGARHAVEARTADAYLDACRVQCEGLDELGRLSGAPIVTDETRALATALSSDSAVVMPAGAGGGDIVLCVSTQPLAEDAPRELFGFSLLPISLGARGVHCAPATSRTVDERAFS